MFYLTKRIDEKQCTIGERCMLLADFSGILAGTKGHITEVYSVGVMVEWENFANRPSWMKPRRDGFSRDELEYLAFETTKHPKVDPTVTRV